MPRSGASRLFWSARVAAGRLPARSRRSAALHACSESIHQIHDVRWLFMLNPLNFLTGGFLLEEILQGLFIAVLILLRREMALFGLHDMRGKIHHFLGDFFLA